MSNKRYNNKGYNAARMADAQTREAAGNRRTAVICVICAVLILAAIVAVVIVSNRPAVSVDMTAIQAEIDSRKVSDFEETDQVTEYVKITVKDHGEIVVRLRKDIAPITVKNFQSLVKDGFYDGLTFHRVYQGFMIQGGDPEGNGSGGSTPIKGEFSANGVTNDLAHVRGVISMARLGNNMDSGFCQFFICDSGNHQDALNGQYASFGYVVAGMDTVDSIAAVPVTLNSYGTEVSTPVETVVIQSIRFVK